MSSTLLRSMKAYQCRGDREMIYALITDTAESNLHPICYNHWPIAAGRKYEVMKTICRMAADVYGGMLKWRGRDWGRDGSCSEFMAYGENTLKRAAELSGPVPDIDCCNILYFKEDDPCADIFGNFEQIGYKVKNFFNEKVLVKEHPTVLDLEIAFRIRDHYESCKRYAQKSQTLNIAKLRKNLYSTSYLFPPQYRNAFKGCEAA